MNYENNDFYQRTFGTHAKLTSKDADKRFTVDPLYTLKKPEFKVMEWPTYAETFGAASRNRT